MKFLSSRTLRGNERCASDAERCEERLRELALAAVQTVEVGGEHGDVLAACAERREDDLHDGEAVVEVLAERALVDALRERSIRGGHDPDVDGVGRVAADAPDGARLEGAEELRLRGERKLADRVGTKGPSLRGEAAWIERATTSLPVPVSRCTSTVDERGLVADGPRRACRSRCRDRARGSASGEAEIVALRRADACGAAVDRRLLPAIGPVDDDELHREEAHAACVGGHAGGLVVDEVAHGLAEDPWP